jgi:ELWxxDGT repeat protein
MNRNLLFFLFPFLGLYLNTNAQATLEADIKTGDNASNPAVMTVYDGKLYFQADDGIAGTELWSYDGTTAVLEADIQPGSMGSSPIELCVYGGKLYFNADNGVGGKELWSYNGTSAVLEAEIYSGIFGSSPHSLTVYDSKLYFAASDGINGEELWSYDGTNTILEADIRLGTSGSYPHQLSLFDGKLFFQASDGYSGTELWSFSNTTGINNAASEKGILVFPNPTAGQIHIVVNTAEESMTMKVFNVMGTLVTTEQLKAPTYLDYQLPETEGMYIIQLVGSDGTDYSFTIIKK